MHMQNSCPISQKHNARHGNTHGKRYNALCNLQWKCVVCGVCVCVCVGVWVGGSGWRRTAASGEADGAHAHAAATQPTASETRACARRATQASHLQLLASSSLLFGRPVGQHTITNDQACDQEGGQHCASASRLMGNAAVKCSDAAVRQRTEDTERGARLEAHLARLTTSSRSTRTRRFTNVHLWRYCIIKVYHKVLL